MDKAVQHGSTTSPVIQARKRETRLIGRFRVADWDVYPAINRVSRGEHLFKLEPKVMEVLVYLADRPEQVVTRAELENAVWTGTVVSYDAVTGTIRKLRKVLGDNPKQPRIIETISKHGYRLVAPVDPNEGKPVENPRTLATNAALASRPALLLRSRFSAMFIVGIAIIGLLFWVGQSHEKDAVAGKDAVPSIAVLPFDNLTGDTAQDYLVDGVTDDLITGLARRPELLVIARDSSFFYRSEDLDIDQISKELSVRFILRGSVRLFGERTTVNVQLIDTMTGGHIWAEKYEVPTHDLPALHNDITRNIMSALNVGSSVGERQDLGSPRTLSFSAYENFLQGRQHFYLYSNKAENLKARDYFQKAIDADPTFALAYAMLGWTHVFDVMNGWSSERERSLQQAIELATKATTLKALIPVAYFVKGLSYREQGEYVKALVEAQRAIEYDPNYANAHVLLATLLYYAGRPEEGLKGIERAMQINPHHPYNYTFHLGQAYYILRRYQDAIHAFERGVSSNPASERLHVWLAAAYAQADMIDEAEWEVEEVLTLNPDFSLLRLREAFPFKDTEDRQHFLQGLSKAGLR